MERGPINFRDNIWGQFWKGEQTILGTTFGGQCWKKEQIFGSKQVWIKKQFYFWHSLNNAKQIAVFLEV